MKNLAVLDIRPDEATEKLAEYETLLAAERTAEDRAIMQGYRAAARGLPVIRLSATIAAGGFDDHGMPKMAVIRATARDCYARWVSWNNEANLVFSDWDSWDANRGALVGRGSVRVPVADPPAGRSGSWHSARTVVPLIPPKVRPRLRRLGGFHLLWEVEEWSQVPPRDPALLRHVGGDLWSVVAIWDLTDLERYVLTLRIAG